MKVHIQSTRSTCWWFPVPISDSAFKKFIPFVSSKALQSIWSQPALSHATFQPFGEGLPTIHLWLYKTITWILLKPNRNESSSPLPFLSSPFLFGLSLNLWWICVHGNYLPSLFHSGSDQGVKLLHRVLFLLLLGANLAMGITSGEEPLMFVDHPVDVLSLFWVFFPSIIYKVIFNALEEDRGFKGCLDFHVLLDVRTEQDFQFFHLDLSEKAKSTHRIVYVTIKYQFSSVINASCPLIRHNYLNDLMETALCPDQSTHLTF